MITETERPYLAAILGGEGHLSLRFSGSGTVCARVTVSNNSLELHNWLHTRFGKPVFCFVNRKRSKCMNSMWNKQSVIKEMLKAALPHLVIKRRQAEIILEFLSGCEGVYRSNSLGEDRLLNLVVEMQDEHDKSRTREREVN
jgi:hypothetical protein